jgi:NAD(P)-dependent dehydrogenase (short-subunit alcohol dehydrogenase family)
MAPRAARDEVSFAATERPAIVSPVETFDVFRAATYTDRWIQARLLSHEDAWRRIPTMSQPPADPLATYAPGLFAGQTALVTGGGRGIGRSIALGYARLGANVVIASRKLENLEPTAKEIEALGVECLAVPMSIRETGEVDALVQAAIERFGAIDVLVNNAGGQFPARPSQINDRGWRSVIDLNLNGTWNMCSRVGPHMVERGSGAIVNIVHVYVFGRGAPAFAHSGAARAGVVNMTRTLAYYWARHGVRINALAPGSIATQGLREEEYAKSEVGDYETIQTNDIPAHRLGTPDEVAAMTVFLTSPAAAYINGSVLVGDGAQYLGPWSDMFDPETP